MNSAISFYNVHVNFTSCSTVYILVLYIVCWKINTVLHSVLVSVLVLGIGIGRTQ